MIPHVKAAWYVKDYVLRLRFDDGAEGDVDFAIYPLTKGVMAVPWGNVC